MTKNSPQTRHANGSGWAAANGVETNAVKAARTLARLASVVPLVLGIYMNSSVIAVRKFGNLPYGEWLV
jgi:hypothetical protein